MKEPRHRHEDGMAPVAYNGMGLIIISPNSQWSFQRCYSQDIWAEGFYGVYPTAGLNVPAFYSTLLC